MYWNQILVARLCIQPQIYQWTKCHHATRIILLKQLVPRIRATIRDKKKSWPVLETPDQSRILQRFSKILSCRLKQNELPVTGI